MAITFTEKQLDAFYRAASSLKLYSRAEFSDDQNRSLIEKLYVDPLPNEQAFKTLFGNSTTILIGRKGTGKSTVFQRVQREIRKNKSGIISAYMDIRNVYESSQVEDLPIARIEQFDIAMPPEQLRKLLLYKKFLHTLIADLRTELKSQVEQNFLTRLRERVKGSAAEVFMGLDKIIFGLGEPQYENIAGLIKLKRSDSADTKATIKTSASIEINIKPDSVGAGLKAARDQANESSGSNEIEFTDLLMRVIGINDVIRELHQILSAIGVKQLYIFLDDFSELPEEAMRLVVDTLISPLARWSEFIKFKIAAYPGRVYLGSLDKTKIEEFHLDTFGLYGSSGVTKMEEKATEFVERLVSKRINHFCKISIDRYFDTKNNELWRLLFFASMANPRILGHIMLYAYESHLLYGSKIGPRAIQEAAQRYYEEKVAPIFSTGQYRTSFKERSSIFSLKELLEEIVNKARSIRQEERSARGARPYSSHFYVAQEFEDLLSSLELAFFVTKYFEQSDRTGTRVSIYALNFGLCVKYQIAFGRPSERREDRLYFVERVFDYNAVLRSYMAANQEIVCNNCNKAFEIAALASFKTFKMQCPECKVGMCSVVNLSKKYGDMLDAIKPDLLLPETELGILQTLHSEQREMVASEIAGELDCSGQLVGRRAKNLAERTLVMRIPGQVYKYEITAKAETAYFQNLSTAELNLDSDHEKDS